LPDGRPYLLNYHGVTQQIWLASPLTGAHHFRQQEGRWVSTRGADELTTLLEAELAVSLS
jgi:frataxin-like iron-binding protein CyaY